VPFLTYFVHGFGLRAVLAGPGARGPTLPAMVFAPGHFQQASEQTSTRRRFRSRRERVAVYIAGIVTLVLIGLVVFSLTNHQRTTGHGCIDFNYSTMIGGAETYKCGAQARALCATPPTRAGIDGDFQPELYAACRKAGLPTGRS
jgi:hypothetical protein